MTTALALLVLVHACALAGVLIAARHSRRLVDEQGRPLGVNWRETTVPAPAEAKIER